MIADIAIVGGGAAGIMAAIRAAELGKDVALLERNETLGRKILITGKGRCNITNSAPLDVFIKKFGKQGPFLRTAFYKFFNEDLIAFFGARGLELKTERQGRVFPATDKALSVLNVLEKALDDGGVKIIYNARIKGIKKDGAAFDLDTEDGKKIQARKVIIATGGASYKATGSTGDGFHVAAGLGHKIADLRPGLVPLVTKEKWIGDLQGLGLENVRVTFRVGAKRMSSEVGDVMFTHFGVSGPIILDMSGDVVEDIDERKEIPMEIDLKPGLRNEQLESKLVHKFAVKGNVQMKNLMQDILPKKMVPVFLSLLKISDAKRGNQITKDERRAMIDTLKAFPLTITGSLPIEEAMVTGGGVSIKDINPRTMESKIVPGLYFAGEVIEGLAASGGYNLQQAFSTGYLAGESAASV